MNNNDFTAMVSRKETISPQHHLRKRIRFQHVIGLHVIITEDLRFHSRYRLPQIVSPWGIHPGHLWEWRESNPFTRRNRFTVRDSSASPHSHFSCAVPLGLEPRITVPKTVVLPLHYGTMFHYSHVFYCVGVEGLEPPTASV